MYFDRQLWSMTAGLRGRMALGVALGLASLAAGIARFVFLGRLLVRVFEHAPLPAVAMEAAGVAAAMLLRAWLEEARTNLAHRTAARIQEALRTRLFDRIAALGPAWFSGQRTGGVMLTLVDGVEQLQSFFGQYLPQLVISACAPIAIFAFMAWWDLPVAAIMVGAAAFALLAPGFAHRANRESAFARQQAMKRFGEDFLDAVQGLPTLKAFGQGRAFGAKLAGHARALTEKTLWVLGLSVMTRGITDVGIALGAAAALALGAWRVTHGEMSLEALLIVLMAGTEIFRPLRDLRSVLHQGMNGQSAATGVLALLNEPVTAPAARVSTPIRIGEEPSIEFDRVRFGYPGVRVAALDEVSFRAARGERVGVVGPSGAGKSSLVRLLLRFHDPQAGVIRIGEHDLRDLDPAGIRARIAVVAQDTYLFHGSVEDNIRLGRPQASDAEVEAVARAANAHEFILRLPQGYRTPIGERGTRLSGGQRQRIAIARALLLDAPVLILDEALSSVDAENEALIQQALDRLMRGRTTLILAHRLSSVIGADRILVLEGGRVVESGRHAELIRRDGPYRRLMGAQAEADADALCAGSGSREEGSDVSSAASGTAQAEGSGVVGRDLEREAAAIGWRTTLASLMAYIRPWRRQLALTTAFGVSRVAAYIGIGALGALVLAGVKAGVFPQALVVALLVVAPLAGLLHWLESWLAHDMAYRLLAEMRIALFARLEALAPAYLLERRSGDLVALATQDVETVEYFFAHTVAPAIVAVLVPCAVLGVLAAFAWPLAVVLLPFLVYAAASPFLRRRHVDRMGGEARAALGRLGAFVTETIQGMAELMAFRAMVARREQFVGLVRDYQSLRLALLADMARQTERLELATGFGGLAIAVAGAMLVSGGALDAALLPLLILISVAAFLPVSEIAQVGRQLADTIASTRRLHVVETEPVAVRDGPDAPAPTRAPALAFERVRFAYPGRPVAALDGMSFDVAGGSTVALVGSSGAGKTTIANLLLRFWDPGEGAVRIDGADIRSLSLDALRGRIALVTQDTYLFNDTLEANIRLARPGASEADLLHAIGQAALSPFLESLPEGLATRVGERGVQLSGGQRQRIAIARAFLRDAPILVLDEATSHLDAISEAQVRAALGSLMSDRTTVLIAHRLSTIRSADRILVLRDGRVIEQGAHAELIARRGFYARLVDRQVAGGQERVAG